MIKHYKWWLITLPLITLNKKFNYLTGIITTQTRAHCDISSKTLIVEILLNVISCEVRTQMLVCCMLDCKLMNIFCFSHPLPLVRCLSVPVSTIKLCTASNETDSSSSPLSFVLSKLTLQPSQLKPEGPLCAKKGYIILWHFTPVHIMHTPMLHLCGRHGAEWAGVLSEPGGGWRLCS